MMSSELIAPGSMVPHPSFNSTDWGAGWMVVHEATGRIEDDTSRVHRYDALSTTKMHGTPALAATHALVLVERFRQRIAGC
jgi:hypothetical protein